MITALCSSETPRIRADLFNNELKSNSLVGLGLIGVSLLELDEKVWTVELAKEQINACYADREKTVLPMTLFGLHNVAFALIDNHFFVHNFDGVAFRVDAQPDMACGRPFLGRHEHSSICMVVTVFVRVSYS